MLISLVFSIETAKPIYIYIYRERERELAMILKVKQIITHSPLHIHTVLAWLKIHMILEYMIIYLETDL